MLCFYRRTNIAKRPLAYLYSSSPHLQSCVCDSAEEEHKPPNKCWKCGAAIATCCALFCANCGKIQPVEGKCCNYFDLLKMPQQYQLNIGKLQKKYHEYQRLLHPDKFSMSSAEEKNISNVTSTTVNEAYNLLRCPIDRAKYLLTLYGYETMLDEDSEIVHEKQSGAELMQMYELREEIDEISSLQAAKALLERLHNEVMEMCAQFEEDFKGDDLEHITGKIIKLKYLSKAIEELNVKLTRLE